MQHVPIIGKCRHGIYNCSDCDWSEWLKKQKLLGWQTDEEKAYIYKRVTLLSNEELTEPEQ